jgi:hypothetical protein
MNNRFKKVNEMGTIYRSGCADSLYIHRMMMFTKSNFLKSRKLLTPLIGSTPLNPWENFYKSKLTSNPRTRIKATK